MGSRAVARCYHAPVRGTNSTRRAKPEPPAQEVDYNTSCEPGYKFAGMEYDSETGNYYDHARYYNPRLGRFMTPDPSNAGAVAGNPQSWNAYSYVVNNPETFIDPFGMQTCQAGMVGTTDGADGPMMVFCPGTSITVSATPSNAGLDLFMEPMLQALQAGPSEIRGLPLSARGGSLMTQQPQTPTCELVAPTGRFRTASGVDARFNSATSQMLSEALGNLNQQGIVPVITSGYRSPAAQAALTVSNSPYVITPAQVSWHEAGAAVDIGPNSNAGSFPAIVRDMIQAGFVWGGTFRIPDRPHFQSEPAGTSPAAAMVEACAGAANGG